MGLIEITAPNDYARGLLIEAAYSDAFQADPGKLDLSPLGFEMIAPVFGTVLGSVEPFGFTAVDKASGSQYDLILRGTDPLSIRDWMADDKVRLRAAAWCKGQVHTGSADIFDTLTLPDPQWFALRIPTVSGHSLGGWLATYSALRYNLPLVTFASPRAGDAVLVAWALTVIPRVKRYASPWDLVTDCPPEALGYRHYGTPTLAEGRNALLRLDPVYNHSLSTYLAA